MLLPPCISYNLISTNFFVIYLLKILIRINTLCLGVNGILEDTSDNQEKIYPETLGIRCVRLGSLALACWFLTYDEKKTTTLSLDSRVGLWFEFVEAPFVLET